MFRSLMEYATEHQKTALLLGVGVLSAMLIYTIGRRLLAAREAKQAQQEPSVTEETYLKGIVLERRSVPRRAGNTTHVEVRLEVKGETGQGCVLNRSNGGICVLLDKPFPSRSRVQIRSRENNKGLWADAEVRYCRPQGGDYEIGLQFTEALSWAQMMQFG